MKSLKYPAQEFEQYQVQYKKNKVTGELEELPDKLDIVEFVQSFKETAFSSLLDKFLQPQKFNPQVPLKDDNGELLDMSIVQSDLDELQNASMLVEEVKSYYNLPNDYNLKQVYDYSKLVMENLKKYKENLAKNEKVSSQEIKQEVKSQDVQTSGEESTQA